MHALLEHAGVCITTRQVFKGYLHLWLHMNLGKQNCTKQFRFHPPRIMLIGHTRLTPSSSCSTVNPCYRPWLACATRHIPLQNSILSLKSLTYIRNAFPSSPGPPSPWNLIRFSVYLWHISMSSVVNVPRATPCETLIVNFWEGFLHNSSVRFYATQNNKLLKENET